MSTTVNTAQETLGAMAEELTDKSKRCEECDKVFNKISHYERHMREKHTDNRDYVCPQEGCNKTFKRSSHLKRHMISHTGDKKYPCEHCFMTFGYKHHLERHVKVVHLSERLECVLCKLQFKKKKAYHKHMARAHGIAEDGTKMPKKVIKEELGVASQAVNSTRMPLDDSRSEESEEVDKQDHREEKEVMLYRCHYEGCLSAFEGLSELKRHINNLHSSSPVSNKNEQ